MKKFQPQPGVIAENRRQGLFLILQVNEPTLQNAQNAIRLCQRVPILTRDLALASPAAQLTCTVSFGSLLWDLALPRERPMLLRPFTPIEGATRRVANTGGDIFFHICSDRSDLNFELGREILSKFGSLVTILEEVQGFMYLDSRDLTGFEDGTANPQGEERAEVALISAEDPRFEGGSYVLVQKYIHNLKNWETLTIAEQEKIVGRTKASSEELPPEEKPATSHIARVEISENGSELRILRHSLPFGTLRGESGLFFVAYAKDPTIFEKMLKRMMGASDDGGHDQLMTFTQAVSSAAFFAPSQTLLASNMGIGP